MGRLPAILSNLAQAARHFGLSLLVIGSVACTTSALRRHTYAPELAYIERSELRTTMHALARGVNRVDALLRQTSLSEADRSEISSTLTSLVEIAQGLGKTGETNHPELDANLDRFVRDLNAAATSAAHDPPNYFLAGSVTAACTYCHH